VLTPSLTTRLCHHHCLMEERLLLCRTLVAELQCAIVGPHPPDGQAAATATRLLHECTALQDVWLQSAAHLQQLEAEEQVLASEVALFDALVEACERLSPPPSQQLWEEGQGGAAAMGYTPQLRLLPLPVQELGQELVGQASRAASSLASTALARFQDLMDCANGSMGVMLKEVTQEGKHNWCPVWVAYSEESVDIADMEAPYDVKTLFFKDVAIHAVEPGADNGYRENCIAISGTSCPLHLTLSLESPEVAAGVVDSVASEQGQAGQGP